MKKSILLRFFLIFSLFLFAKNIQAQQLTATINNSGCFGDPIDLFVTGGSPPYQINWNDGNIDVGSILQSNFTHFYNNIGTYIIDVTDTQGDSTQLSTEVFPCQIDIVGNFNPCQGACETYFTSIPNQFVFWEIFLDGISIFQTDINPMEYCWIESGVYIITAQDDTGQVTEQIVIVNPGLPIEIVSLSNTFCAADSLNPTSCDKICANATAIYTVPNGQNVIWEVLGADSYVENGNQVTVEWGAPGSGQVIATTPGGGGSTNLLVNANGNIQDGINGFDLSLQAFASGGVSPYTYQWTDPNGAIITSPTTSFPAAPGTYICTVIDQNGNTATASVLVVNDGTGNGCVFAFSVNTTNESECDFCDGEGQVVTSSPFSTNFTYLWSNGGTNSGIGDLCTGTYSVIVIDDFGCEGELGFQINCPIGTSTCPSTASLCIDILENPDADFTTIPAAVNGVVNICEGGTVVFNNESAGATLFEWNFGNGSFSTAMNTEATYLTAGTYEAYLISRNDCYCSDTSFVTIEVADAITPTLDCVGTICENTTVTYSTDASCSGFSWTITGDYNIIDGGGAADNFITIEWLSGPEGIIELGVSSCSGGNYCLAPTIELIPIISDNAEIKGPEKVCRLDESTYYMEDYSATDFNWSVTSGGTILEGQNTNSIKVRWEGQVSPNVQQIVSVDYDNCYLGCGGSDTKDIFILPDLYLKGDIEACENGMSLHEAKKDIIGVNDVMCDWTVTAGDGTVVWTSPASTDQVNLDWNTIAASSGRYAILAIPSNPLEVCTPYFTSYIRIVELPTAPTSITGITQICPGEVYTYDVQTLSPDYIFSWTINDGGVISNQEGSSINVTFGNTPPYILSVTQTSTAGLACESQPVDLAIFPLPAFTINGDGNVCEESGGTYIADFFSGVKYEWSLVPADAGTILSGGNTNTIEVFWHQAGNANVQVTMCGSTEILPVAIIAKPEPVVTGDSFVCPGDAATVGVAGTYDSYLWKTETGSTITNTSTATLPAGAFELVVTNSFGCENNVSFVIEGYPKPAVTVSVPGSRLRCYTGPNPDPIAEIHATEVPAGYTYQWYIDGVAQAGMNSSVITSAEFGTFQVAVFDQNGCETFSNTIIIWDFCGSGGVCNNPGLALVCDQGTDVQMAFAVTSECDIFNFENVSPNFVSGTEQWDFDDIASGTNNSSAFPNPSHQFSNVGYYIVTLTALTPAGIICYDSKLVTVPVSPNFNFGTACIGEPLAFEDLTGFLPGEVVQNWSWDFGDPTSGANNISTDQNPAHAYSASGTYDVTLTVGHGIGCTATRVKTITIEAPPTIDFDEPVLNCEGTALSFTAMASVDVLFYEWNFGDAASGVANISEIVTPFHSYENAGNYNVTCTVTDIWGCTGSVTKVVTIAPNTLVGQISFSAPSPICEGDVTTLTAPSGGISWEWSDGTFGESITTGEAGAYTVTITNNIGCQYIPPAAVLDVIPLPTTAIQAVEYDEFGQPVNVFYDNYSTCEGEDIYLEGTNPTTNYTFTWSDGLLGSEIEYSANRGNQLAAGTYSLTLDILDISTGCSNTVGPFDIVVHPTPTNIQISSSPLGAICENTLTTFTVDNPSVDLTYIWNTGELGTSIQVSAAGEYFVRGITMFGCSGESNKIEINQGPDLKKIPDGCHTRCKPDTICLPTINGVVDYQWYLDGTLISGPAGTIGDYVALESGDYNVVMTDANGCVTTSDILSLDLYDGFGTFEGNVYMDVNENGIIDGPDTLVSGIDIILNDNGVVIDTVTSGTNGSYTFDNIPSVGYNLDLDTNGLPANIIAVWNDLDSTLFGCDDMEVVDWLLQINCILSITALTDTVCFGENYIFDGDLVPIGVPTDFEYSDVLGCDSIITVTITELPNNSSYIDLSSCGGSDVIYNGVTYPVGITETIMTTPEGCNYIDTVDIIPFPTSATILNFDICPDETVEYEDLEYGPGSQLDFIYLGQNGCDSIVTLIVDGFPQIQFDLLSEEPCRNGSEGTITIENPTGTAPFTYSLDGNNFQAIPLFENLFATNYMIYVQDGNGCVQEQTFTLQGDPQLQINLPGSLLPCDGSDLTLAPQILAGDVSNLTYLWSDGSTEPQLTVNEEGTYVVGVSNECETVVQEVQISYDDDDINSYLYIPNAFSPNGDGNNDQFKVYPSPNVSVESFELIVFDRWGNHLYDTSNTSEGWDGTLNSKAFNPGVYVYHLRIKVNSCGRTLDLFKKGDVTIVK
jgi:gliding motility-associated-like protein